MSRRWIVVAGVVVAGVVVAVLVAGGLYARSLFSIDVPDYPAPTRSTWLEQHWTDQERITFHHASQGTRTFVIPYEWFMALERPELSFGSAGFFSDPAYLDRFGFIRGEGQPESRPLPVGFAQGTDMVDPSTGATWSNPATEKPFTAIGFTCAACHSGRMTYKGTEILIDGAPALINLGEFQKALGVALFFTKLDPWRFDRFSQRLLGDGGPASAKDALKAQLDGVLKELKQIQDLQNHVQSASVIEGFGRLDALNRIGNQVFALDLKRPENYAATSAPVNYPHIWDASWFDWVQYNGSIEQPMVRNAGEALGVRALISLTGPRPLYDSTLNLNELALIERGLAGQQPTAAAGFSGLRPPKWPADILPPIDPAKAQRGKALYAELCKGCHLAPVGDPAFWSDANWTPPNSANERYLVVKMIPITKIKTDPAQAADMKNRTVTTPPELGIKDSAFGPALGDLVEKTDDHWYEKNAISGPARDKMDGFRPNGIRAELSYKARPLDGIWATPPYLHNGSVPTLYALLSPVSERPKTFQLGQREFDPVKVGYSDATIAGKSEIDTDLRGNANTGHEFCDRADCIGRALTPQERSDLVEFLKTL